MLPHEAALIESPLVRMIDRNSDAAALMAQWLDPLAVLAGLGMWSTRLIRQARAAKREQDPQPAEKARPATRPAGPPPNNDGRAPIPSVPAELFQIGGDGSGVSP